MTDEQRQVANLFKDVGKMRSELRQATIDIKSMEGTIEFLSRLVFDLLAESAENAASTECDPL